MKKYKSGKFFCLLFFVFPSLTFAQYSDKWISLKYESVRHRPNHFYFSKVIDERKDRSKIGTIFGENLEVKSLKLSGGINKTIQNYFSKSIIKDTSTYPIFSK